MIFSTYRGNPSASPAEYERWIFILPRKRKEPPYHQSTELQPASTENREIDTADFSPLAQGVLTGKYSNGKVPEGSRGSDEKINMFMKDKLTNTELLKQVDALGPIADVYGLSIAQLSLAWILQNPGISSVIIGATGIEQLEQNVKASGVVLKKEDMARIEELFPVGE